MPPADLRPTSAAAVAAASALTKAFQAEFGDSSCDLRSCTQAESQTRATSAPYYYGPMHHHQLSSVALNALHTWFFLRVKTQSAQTSCLLLDGRACISARTVHAHDTEEHCCIGGIAA